MDVKTPGDGRTYCIGTTIVPDTDPNNGTDFFSGVQITGPSSVLPVTSSRQVAILQVSDSNGILWQQYFYGETLLPFPPPPGNGKSTFGRAIAVFVGTSASETRIAICGETLDRKLPNAITLPNTHTGNNFASGYVAVYDGIGNLKWSRQFYGQDDSAATAITDVSIHVANGNDVVTYCGASTNGAFVDPNQPVQSTMVPTNCSFQVPSNPPCGDTPAPHDIHNASNTSSVTAQWDGIVGRVQKPHGFTQTGQATANTLPEFHGIVGGRDQDGLFGISELSPTEFVVVGSTTRSSAGNGRAGDIVPLTNPSVFNAAQGSFCFSNSTGGSTPWQSFGTVFRFIAAPQSLVLQSSTLIGSEGASTVARDVLWHNGLIWIVGSTNDPNFTTLDPSPYRSTLYASVEGYVVTCVDPGATSPFLNATFLNSHVDSVTGVAAWSEFPDHVAVFGRSNSSGSGTNLYVASLFRDTSLTTPSVRVIRSTNLGGSEDEQPAFAEGMTIALGSTSAVPWHPSTSSPTGGGIAVDPRGRVTAVGATFSRDYPVSPASSLAAQRHSVPHVPLSTDAVRSELDMLPTGSAALSACRTDGTGTCPSPGWSALPSYTGTGGTTPTCGTNLPAIRRMFIDFEGDLAAGSTNATILVDRPPDGAILRASLMWLGFPATLPTVTPEGIEVWVGSQTAITQWHGNLGQQPPQSLVVPLGTLPAGTIQFSIQFICLLSSQACPNNSASLLGASPALVFGY